MANTPLNNITIDGKLYDVLNAIPTEQNKLLYSFDNQTLKTDYLMYTDGLVVDNDDDFELCKEGADVSMSTVSSTWIKWGDSRDIPGWGYYSSDGSKTGELIGDDSYKYKFTDFYLNGKPEGYIYNTLNTYNYTGYYSRNNFKDYNSHIAMGIMSNSTEEPYVSSFPNLNDYMAVLPVFNVINENGTTTYYGITVSVMNASERMNSRDSFSGSGSHTISIECYSLTNLISNTGTVISLLNDNIGKRIIAYNETFNNSSSTGLASVIQTKIKKYNDIITLWFSDPYSTYDNDGEHQVHSDRPVIIDLKQYNITYTDMSGNTSTIDFTSNSSVINIFDKLRGGARRGYEVSSNPGSIFRNLTTDEIILNMSPDENFNTTWEYYQDSGWTNSTQELGTPTQLFTGSKLSFNRITNKLFYSDGTDITYIGNISSGSTNEGGNTISDLMINVTYEKLKNLKDASGLTAGMQYRLTDYECTVANDTIARAINTGHFDLILVADDETTLNENVRFTHNEDDGYFAGCNLSAWEGKYCLDNDTDKYAWADPTNGKGVIYWLKDEWNNECPYDFKNIQFKRVAISNIEATGITSEMLSELQTTFVYENNGGICYGQVNGVPSNVSYNNIKINYTFDNTIEKYYYTFTWVDESGDVQDASIVGQRLTNNGGKYSNVFNNQIQPVSQNMFYYMFYSLNNIVFVSSYSFKNGVFYGYYGNKFGVNCYNNTFGNRCTDNTFGNNCNSNTFGNYYISNTLGNSCGGNTFGNSCSSNTFGYDCDYNTFGYNFHQNTFGNDCNNNTFGNSCWNNTFGNICNYNTFGNSCYKNIFKNECNSNTIGNYCDNNTFGNECKNNTFGNDCDNNTFENYCNYNTFGYNFQSNTFGNNCYQNTFVNDYIKQCRFGDGIQYCTIGNMSTGNLSYLQNITFLNNIKGNSNSKQDLNENNYLSINIDSVNKSHELFCGFDKNNVYKCKTMFDSML